MMQILRSISSNVKDVEANAERERRKNLERSKTGKPVSVRLGKFGPMAQIELLMMKRRNLLV
jgi:DNA topoisomerase-1